MLACWRLRLPIFWTWQSKCVNCGDWYDQAVSFADFEANLSGNLYKLWNRMSSGSYFPPPVRREERSNLILPKGDSLCVRLVKR